MERHDGQGDWGHRLVTRPASLDGSVFTPGAAHQAVHTLPYQHTLQHGAAAERCRGIHTCAVLPSCTVQAVQHPTATVHSAPLGATAAAAARCCDDGHTRHTMLTHADGTMVGSVQWIDQQRSTAGDCTQGACDRW